MHENLRRGGWLLAVAGLLGCYPAAAVLTQVPAAPSAAGTYHLSICQGACAGQPMVSGLLVLSDRPFTLERLSEPAQRYLHQKAVWLLVHIRELAQPNACFALQRQPGASTVVGSIPSSITDWRTTGRAVAVTLFVSPDAGYVAELELDGQDLRGHGFSWGMPGPYHRTDETIAATRVGPPDMDRCLRQIETEAMRGAGPERGVSTRPAGAPPPSP